MHQRIFLRTASSALCRIIFLLLLPAIASAQDLDDATIAGIVTDERHALIPDATIRVEAATGSVRTTQTDAEGRYRIVDLAPGTYQLRATLDAFAPTEVSGVAVAAGQSLQLDLVLLPAGVTAEQTVSAEAGASAVDTARTLVGGAVTREEIELLPTPGRAPLDLIFTLPGITDEPLATRGLAEDRQTNAQQTPEEAAGVFAVAGGQAYSNNITIDGMDNNDDRAARERFQPSLESVEEVQVIANQFSAEYGRASGGRVNLRTRGGTPNYRGRAFYFFQDEALNANSWHNNTRALPRAPLQQHDFGFTLSGPLRMPVSDSRTYFFLAYEHDRALDSAVVNTLVPVLNNSLFPLPAPTLLANRRFEISATEPHAPAEVAPFVEIVSTPLKNSIATVRVDHTFSERHNATFTYHAGRLHDLRQFSGGHRLAESLQGRRRRSDSVSYAGTHIFSPRMVNQTRLQFSHLAPQTSAIIGAEQTPVVLINIDAPSLDGEIEDRAATLVAGNSTSGSSQRRETRLQLQNTLTFVRDAHSFKFGGELQFIRSTFIDLADASGTYNFDSVGDFLANAPTRFRQSFGNSSRQKNTYTSLFAHDEWRANSRLMLSYGLRYENESVLRDRNNWAPRIGVVLDPSGSGKQVVRFGAGVFYNRALLRTIDDFTLGANRLLFDTNALRDPVTGKTLTPSERRQFVADYLVFPQTLAAGSALVQSHAVRELDFVRRLDPTLRIPESFQFNLGFEREVGRGFFVEVNYTRNRGAHLWREFNANAPVLPGGYSDFTAYLLSRDFSNFRDARSNARPLYQNANAGELVRFVLAPSDAAKPEPIGRTVDAGVPVSLINLNSVRSTSSLEAAAAALRFLRPDPERGQIEQLASIGNSFYQGLTVEARRRWSSAANDNFNLSFRAAYTLSSLIDDGVVNTSDALRSGDFRGERARSLLDRRHRFLFAGTVQTPRIFGNLAFSPVLRLMSGAPFNISLGAVDRNLDDVGNDRPLFSGDLKQLRARLPDRKPDAELLDFFSLPIIGQTGNLPRNAGLGPGLAMFDLSVTRTINFGEDGRLRLRPMVEFENVLNHAAFSFGAEFINFTAAGAGADPATRQAFLESFLVPSRTLRPRTVRLGLRFDF